MKFIRTTYPDYPGMQGSPCWKIKSRWLDIDADWNMRFPFGVCLGIHVGRQPPPGFTLDLNAPEGEPNRLYIWLGRWHAILGLPSCRDLRPTGRYVGGSQVWEHYSSWRSLHIDGCARYLSHKDETGKWVRNDKPEPLHWGWLTIERRWCGAKET